MDEEVFASGSFGLIPAQRNAVQTPAPREPRARYFAGTDRSRPETISKEKLIARARSESVVEEPVLKGPCLWLRTTSALSCPRSCHDAAG
jgi:hypothetical protein